MVYTNSKNGYFHIFQRGGSTTNQIIKMISELEGWGWWYIIDILDFRSGQPNNIDNPDQQSGFADDFEFGHPWIESLFFWEGESVFLNIQDEMVEFTSENMWLVGGLEHEFYDFPFSWEFHVFHHPNWRSHIFQRGSYTTNQVRIGFWPGHIRS